MVESMSWAGEMTWNMVAQRIGDAHVSPVSTYVDPHQLCGLSIEEAQGLGLGSRVLSPRVQNIL